MISARIWPDFRFAVIGTKSYFAGGSIPGKPQDLMRHLCINFRFSTFGAGRVAEGPSILRSHNNFLPCNGPMGFEIQGGLRSNEPHLDGYGANLADIEPWSTAVRVLGLLRELIPQSLMQRMRSKFFQTLHTRFLRGSSKKAPLAP